jgi:hypothetical protein
MASRLYCSSTLVRMQGPPRVSLLALLHLLECCCVYDTMLAI